MPPIVVSSVRTLIGTNWPGPGHSRSGPPQGAAAAPGEEGQPVLVGEAEAVRDLLDGGRGYRRLGRQAVHDEVGGPVCGQDRFVPEEGFELVEEGGLLDHGCPTRRRLGRPWRWRYAFGTRPPRSPWRTGRPSPG